MRNWFRVRGYPHFDRPVSRENAEKIVQSLVDKRHSFLPFVFFEVKKRRIKRDDQTFRKEFGHKIRPIMYASHVDSHIFAYYACYLQDRYENYIANEQFLPSTYEAVKAIVAYRKLGKNNIGFAKEAFDFAESIGSGVVLTRDVSDFFGTIRHDILKQRWLSILGNTFQTLPPDHFQVFRAITQYSSITQEEIKSHFELNEAAKPLQYGTIQQLRTCIRQGKICPQKNCNPYGIPQGSPISAVLSNIYMLEFDKCLIRETHDRQAFYHRYSDDIIVICKECDREYFSTLIQEQMQCCSLKLSENKSEECRFDFNQNGFEKSIQYLGIEFCRKKCLLRSATLANHKRKAIQCIRNEYRLARKNGWPKIRRKRIYNLYTALEYRKIGTGVQNLETKQEVECHTPKRRFWDYLLEANHILCSNDEIKKQYRRHFAWLNKIIHKYQKKLDVQQS